MGMDFRLVGPNLWAWGLWDPGVIIVTGSLIHMHTMDSLDTEQICLSHDMSYGLYLTVGDVT